MSFAGAYEKTMWRWFNKRAMEWVQIAKLHLRPGSASSRPWVLIRGTKGRRGHRQHTFETLGDAINALYDPELEALVESHDLNPMEFIAMAADEGEAE